MNDESAPTWSLLTRLIHAGERGTPPEGLPTATPIYTTATYIYPNAAALDTAHPDVVLVEQISNPLLKVVDIDALARRAHAAGARLVVDNTITTPIVQRPLDLGADLVVHSATKYLSGHADATGGIVVA